MTDRAAAATVTPIAYQAPNGDSVGATLYHDESHPAYVAGANADNVLLSGGVGDLADGVIPTQSWIDVEPDPGPGPYVGWVGFTPLTLTFDFDRAYAFRRIVAHGDAGDLQDDGSRVGGVLPPLSVAVSDGDGTSAGSFTLGNAFVGVTSYTLDLAAPFVTDRIELEFGLQGFTMLSEVTFEVVPLPPALGLLAGGVAALGLAARRRRP